MLSCFSAENSATSPLRVLFFRKFNHSTRSQQGQGWGEMPHSTDSSPPLEVFCGAKTASTSKKDSPTNTAYNHHLYSVTTVPKTCALRGCWQ